MLPVLARANGLAQPRPDRCLCMPKGGQSSQPEPLRDCTDNLRASPLERAPRASAIIDIALIRQCPLQQNPCPSGIIIVDDNFRILSEYKNRTSLHPPKGVGDVFLKCLLRHSANPRVEQISLTETRPNHFDEFPDRDLEPSFDAPDRKFVAVANAHPEKPPSWQAVDCK